MRQHGQEIALWVTLAGGVLLPMHGMSMDPIPLRESIVSTTCQKGCPFRCSAGTLSLPAATSPESLDRFLQVCAQIPTYHLSSHQSLINHWELLRELYWEEPPGAAAADVTGFTSGRQSSTRADLNLLIKGLYIRSFPPPTYRHAIEIGAINPAAAHDPRVMALLNTLLAGEELQSPQPPSAPSVPNPAQGQGEPILEEATRAFPSYFYLRVVKIMGALPQGAGAQYKSPMAATTALKGLTTALEEALTAFLAVHAALPHPKFPVDTVPFDWNGLVDNTPSEDLLVYITYYNDWLEIECWKAHYQARPAPEREAVVRGTREFLDHLRDKAGVPPALRENCEVTFLEYMFLTRVSEEDTQDFESRARWLVNALFDSRTQLDGYDAAQMLNYLRNGSPHLRDAWTPHGFDSIVAERGRTQ